MNLSHYYDLLISSTLFLCGGILLFEGWRLDPILLLCQMLSSIIAFVFISENLILRDSKTKRSTHFLMSLSKKSYLAFDYYRLKIRPYSTHAIKYLNSFKDYY
jgi:hypothetical protein